MNHIKLNKSNVQFINKFKKDFLNAEKKWKKKYTISCKDFENEQILLDLFDINLCFIQDYSNYCKIVGENNVLLIPENNLYNGEDNKLKYIYSLVHDILLNENVKKQFINDSHNIINLDKNYSINDNEIILLEKKLLDYYNNLQYPQSDYVLQNVYENIQPHDIMSMLDYKMYKNVDDIAKWTEEITGRKFVPTNTFTGAKKTFDEAVDEAAAWQIRNTYPKIREK